LKAKLFLGLAGHKNGRKWEERNRDSSNVLRRESRKTEAWLKKDGLKKSCPKNNFWGIEKKLEGGEKWGLDRTFHGNPGRMEVYKEYEGGQKRLNMVTKGKGKRVMV